MRSRLFLSEYTAATAFIILLLFCGFPLHIYPLNAVSNYNMRHKWDVGEWVAVFGGSFVCQGGCR